MSSDDSHHLCLDELTLTSLQNDTQMVSIIFRTHKGLSTTSKISSLYVFDALARAARDAIDKKKVIADPTSATGNCATFLLKLEGILESFVQDLLGTKSIEVKVSIISLPLESSNCSCGHPTLLTRDRLAAPLALMLILHGYSEVDIFRETDEWSCATHKSDCLRHGSGADIAFAGAEHICDCNRLDFLEIANNRPYNERPSVCSDINHDKNSEHEYAGKGETIPGAKILTFVYLTYSHS